MRLYSTSPQGFSFILPRMNQFKFSLQQFCWTAYLPGRTEGAEAANIEYCRFASPAKQQAVNSWQELVAFYLLQVHIPTAVHRLLSSEKTHYPAQSAAAKSPINSRVMHVKVEKSSSVENFCSFYSLFGYITLVHE